MPVRAVCKPRSPDLKRGALATDARGCSLWRSLLERRSPGFATRSVSWCGPVSGGLHVHVFLFDQITNIEILPPADNVYYYVLSCSRVNE